MAEHAESESARRGSSINPSASGVEQLRSVLAARIVRALDARKLTVRQAQVLTGFAAADFSRVRRAHLARFTVDRLMTMLARLGDEIEVTVCDHPSRMNLRDATLTDRP